MKLKEYPKSFYHTWRLQLKAYNDFKIETKPKLPVIVSLTSIPSRLKGLTIVIKSILDQDQLPQKIILWLHEDLKSQIPTGLKKLTGEIFQIKYTTLKVSHKKLIHTIPLYPNLPIITIDDDFIYPKNLVSSLYQAHLKNPKIVIANFVRAISYNDLGNIEPYKQWIYNENIHQNSFFTIAVGGSGVIYPPRALHPHFNNENLFLKLAPKADDLWFKAMQILQGTKVKKNEYILPEPIPISGSQTIALKKENIGEDKNVVQWQQLQNHFNLKSKLFV